MPMFSRIRARMHGETAAGDLQGYRRAGASVYDLVTEVDQHRVDAMLAGQTPWTVDAATQAAALCGWNAFVLQTLGDAHLDAHDEHGPQGYAGEQTHDQALAYYHAVQEWVEHGRAAESTPAAHRLDAALPAHLPGPVGAWRQPYPPLHIRAMRSALETVGARAEANARELLAASDSADHADRANAVRQLLAAARTSAQYADAASSADLEEGARTTAGRQLHGALDQWYGLGQLVAMPSLIDGAHGADRPATAS